MYLGVRVQFRWSRACIGQTVCPHIPNSVEGSHLVSMTSGSGYLVIEPQCSADVVKPLVRHPSPESAPDFSLQRLRIDSSFDL